MLTIKPSGAFKTIRPALGHLIFLSIISIFNFHFSTSRAQQPWNYTSLQEASHSDAYFVTPPAPLQAKVARYTGTLQNHYNRIYRLSTLCHNDGRVQVVFQSDTIGFSLPSDLATELLPYLVSCRYWQQRYDALQEWAFVFMDRDARLLIDIDTADRRYGPYSPVTWLGYRYQPSAEWPVVFTVRTNTHRRQELTLPALQRLAEWGSFTTDEGQHAYELRRDSILRSQKNEQLALQRRIDSLNRVSLNLARQADSIAVSLRNDSLQHIEQQTLLQVQATKERMDREQIFLMSLNPARSDYMFGLEVNLYNCFPKTISSVEISIIPVDAKGRLQRDRFKRDERTILCMGPIQPRTPAQYTFDELFWDDSDRIKYIRLTDITFHFADGSRRTFSGYEKILKHTLNP